VTHAGGDAAAGPTSTGAGSRWRWRWCWTSTAATFLVDDGALDPRLTTTLLALDPYVVLRSVGDWPVAGREAMADLHGADLIGQPEDNPCQVLIEHGLAAHGLSPTFVFRSVDNGAAQAMVRSGMGRAVMPYLAVDPDDARIEVATLDPPIPPRRIVVAQRAGRTLHPAAAGFVRHARDVCTELTGDSVAVAEIGAG
jgi:DNA-binding transcriptional LysR family regulator